MSKLIHSSYSSRTFDSDVYVVKKEWDAKAAKFVYRLYNQYETFTDGFARPRKHLHFMYEGDEEWAKKTAEHYKVNIMEPSNV